jgi:mannose/fructose/N-acetylgalactosamine-specific phosphotransferase system component IIB
LANFTVTFNFVGNAQQFIGAMNQMLGSLQQGNIRLVSVKQGAIAASQGFNTLGNSVTRFGGRFLAALGIGLGAAGVFGALRLFNTLLKESIGNAAEFQRLSTSFVAILAAPIAERKGQLTPDLLAALRIESERLFQAAQISAVQTVTTTKEYVQTLQTALAVGQQIGLSQEQIEIITKRLVLAAGAFGIEQSKVGTSIAQILTGTVRATNQLGRNLGLVTAEQRKLLKEAIRTGTVFEFIEAKTRSFGALAKEVSDNFINVKASIADIFQIGGARAVQPIFETLRRELINIRDKFINDDNSFSPFSAVFNKDVNKIQDALTKLLPDVRGVIRELVNLFTAFGERLDTGVISLGTLLKVLNAFLRTLSTLVSGPLANFVSFILIIKIFTGLINGVFASLIRLRAPLGIITSAKLAYAEAIKQVVIQTGALTALTEAETAALAAGATATEAATAGQLAYAAAMKGSQAALIGVAAGTRVVTTAIVGFLSRAALIIAAIIFIKSLIDEWSGSADERRKGEEELDKQLQKSEQHISDLAKSYNILNEALELKALSDIKNRTKEQEQELIKLRDTLLQLLDDSTVKALETGKLTKKGLEDIDQALEKLSARTQKQADAFGRLINSDFAKKTKNLKDELENFLSRKPIIDPKETLGSALDQADIEKFQKTIEDLKIAGQALGVTFDEILKNPEAFLEKVKDFNPEIQKLAELINFSNKSFENQAGELAKNQKILEEYRVELRGANALGDDATIKLREYNKILQISGLERTEAINRLNLLSQATGYTTAQIVKQSIATIDSTIATKQKIFAEQQLAVALAATSGAFFLNADAALAAQIAQAKTEEEIADLERKKTVIASLLKTPTKLPSTEGKKKKGGERDQLSDFLKEVERQLSLLKKVGDLVEKESERYVNRRRKIIQELAQAGEIPFQAASEFESQLIENAFNLNDQVSRARQELIDANIGFAKLIADQKQGPRDKKKDKKKTDLRDRDLESFEKLTGEKIDVFIKRVEDLGKAEDQITDTVRKATKERLDLKKKEVDANFELLNRAEQSRAQITDILFGLGIFSGGQNEQAQFEASKKQREIREQQLKEQLFPFLNADFEQEILTARERIKNLVGSFKEAIGVQKLTSEDEFTQFFNSAGGFDLFFQIADKIAELKTKLVDLDKKRATSPKASKAILDDLANQGREIQRQIVDLQASIITVGGQLKLDPEKVKQVAEATQVLIDLNVDQSKKAELLLELDKNRRESAVALLKHLVEQRDIQLDQLKLQNELNEFDLKRLDIIERIVEKQKEIGILNENESRNALLRITQERLQLLEQQKAGLQQRLNTEFPNVGTANQNPEVARKQLDLKSQIDDLNEKLFELKNRAFELSNPLFLTSQGLRKVADAIKSLPDPEFDEFTKKFKGLPFNKLSGVFEGLANLLETLSKRGRPKSPAEALEKAAGTIENAGKNFDDRLLVTGNQFLDIIIKAALGFKQVVSGEETRPRRVTPSIGGDLLNGADTSEFGSSVDDILGRFATPGKANVVQKVGAFALTALNVAADIIGAIGSGDKGQIISTIGRGISQIPHPVAKTIGAIVETVGGIVSFFGARAKQKTKEMAEAITAGIDDLKKAISNGAIGLGDGIRQLQTKLEDARRQLSGRKGGADQLKQITKDINDEIANLRDKAKEVQDNFRTALELLKLPANVRDFAKQITDLKKQVKEFFDSFENPQDALNAIGDIRDFLKLSIGEITDEIKKTQADLLDQLKKSADDFAKSQRDILLEGRIDPKVSEAESKRKRLVELERDFRKQQKEIEDQLAGEKQKLDFVNQRLDIEKFIRKLSRDSAADLGLAADKLTQAALAWQGVVDKLPSLTRSIGATQDINLNLRVNGQPVETQKVGIDASKQLQLSGRINPSLLSRYRTVNQ